MPDLNTALEFKASRFTLLKKKITSYFWEILNLNYQFLRIFLNDPIHFIFSYRGYLGKDRRILVIDPLNSQEIKPIIQRLYNLQDDFDVVIKFLNAKVTYIDELFPNDEIEIQTFQRVQNDESLMIYYFSNSKNAKLRFYLDVLDI